MKRELGLGCCGLACCLCSENGTCSGCRCGGCAGKDGCKCRRCCTERGYDGCWGCPDFPCGGTILNKPRVRGFARFAVRYGAEALLDCLARNEAAGVVYHSPGALTGDYDRAEGEKALFRLLLEGPEGRSPAIREVRRDDLAALLALYVHLHGEAPPEEGPALDALWTGLLADPNAHILVAEEAGRLVSSCTLTVIPNLTRGLRPYALVENVVTAPDRRGRGLATACLNRARDAARAAGCYKIMLLTGAKEEATLRFYEGAGYNRQDKTAFIQWLD